MFLEIVQLYDTLLAKATNFTLPMAPQMNFTSVLQSHLFNIKGLQNFHEFLEQQIDQNPDFAVTEEMLNN